MVAPISSPSLTTTFSLASLCCVCVRFFQGAAGLFRSKNRGMVISLRFHLRHPFEAMNSLLTLNELMNEFPVEVYIYIQILYKL